MKSKLISAIGAVAVLGIAVTGCSSSGGSGGGATSAGSSASAGAKLSGSITVLAASSLTGSFDTIGKQFEAANPGTKVTFSYGSSADLATQITQGNPVDVFASASTKNMDSVSQAGDAVKVSNFASNTMEIATPPKNPAKIGSVQDLAKSSVKVALCEPTAPCGVVAKQVFDNAKITVKPVSLEADVKSTLAKVEIGEVDAGVVYVTDVKAAGSKVTGVQIPSSVNATTEYPISVIKNAPNSAVAQAFVAYVLAAGGQKALQAAGFAGP